MFDTEMDIRDQDRRLLDIHSEMYPFVHYGHTEHGWYIESCDYDESFWTYEDFIEYISTEVKEALLVYALNGELEDIAEAIR